MKSDLGGPSRLVALYVRASVLLLAFIGMVCIVCLQVGWLRADIDQLPPMRVVGPFDSNSPIEATGQKGYFSDFIPVDPSRTYRLSGLFRTSSDNSGLNAVSRVYFGIRVYDEKKQPILGGSGAYRYPAANGVVLTSLEGWVKLQGSITGVSESGQNAFRPKTVWIRIVVVPGYGTSDVVTEVADIEFAEQVDLILLNRDRGSGEGAGG